MENYCKKVKNLNRILFLERKKCHRIFIKPYNKDSRYYIAEGLKIIYILEGKILLEDWQNRVKLNKGDMYIISEDQHYKFEELEGEDALLLVLEISLKDLNYIYEFKEDYIYSGLVMNYNNKLKLTSYMRILLKDRLTPTYSSQKIYDTVVSIVKLLTITTRQLREEVDFNNIESVIYYITKQIPKNIRAGKDLTLSTFADQYKISYYYLSKQFKKHIGMNFTEYLITVKMSIFIDLLINNKNATISSLAYKSGYKSLTSFNKDFKDFFNVTPSQMKLLLKDIIKIKRAVYLDPRIVEFLSNMDKIDFHDTGEILLDLTGMRGLFLGNYNYDILYDNYYRIIDKIKDLKDGLIIINYSYKDYLHIVDLGDQKLLDMLKRGITNIMKICNKNDIKLYFKIE